MIGSRNAYSCFDELNLFAFGNTHHAQGFRTVQTGRSAERDHQFRLGFAHQLLVPKRPCLPAMGLPVGRKLIA